MRRIILTFSCLLFFTSIAYSANPDYPLPEDAQQVMSKDSTYGPMNMHLQIYATAMPKDKLMGLYRKFLKKEGWQEDREMFFKKNNRALIIAISPQSAKFKDGKTMFTIIQSNLPTQEEMTATKKDNPDKLNFMPVYPGSRQMFLFDNPHGASASYTCEDSLKDAVFFYESKMLNYGWTLVSKSPVGGATKSTELKFKKEMESCIIHIYEGQLNQPPPAVEKGADKTQVSDIISPLGKTQILVTYNDFRKL